MYNILHVIKHDTWKRLLIKSLENIFISKFTRRSSIFHKKILYGLKITMIGDTSVNLQIIFNKNIFKMKKKK